MKQKMTLAAVCAALLTALVPASHAQSANSPTVAAAAAQTPDQLINRLSNELLDAVRADKTIQAGDTKKGLALVDEKVVPYVSFQRMTSSAVGRYWRQATPEQQASLENEFKTLLMRTYAGALAQVKDQTVAIKPSRNLPEDEEQIVRTEVRGGGGDPVQLDYRVEKSPTVGWKIYDVNVLGVWLVENYRNSFAQEISKGGIDGLIAKLSERNKTAAARK